jgi:hypothetical protein
MRKNVPSFIKQTVATASSFLLSNEPGTALPIKKRESNIVAGNRNRIILPEMKYDAALGGFGSDPFVKRCTIIAFISLQHNL